MALARALPVSPKLRRANEWTRDQLAAMGCSNAHLEDWGEFGMGWQQLNTWVRYDLARHGGFHRSGRTLVASTKGAVNGQAIWFDIKEEKDFDEYTKAVREQCQSAAQIVVESGCCATHQCFRELEPWAQDESPA
jgi:hypothetical protein